MTACDPEIPDTEGGDDRVIDGDPVADGDYAFMTALYLDADFKCSAVAIDPQWILTAAHCFYDLDDNWTLEQPLSDFEGVVGRTDLGSNDGIEVKFDQVHRLHPAEGFNTSVDLAVAHITTVLPADHIATLAPSEPGVGATVRIMGYGADENNRLPGRLLFRDTERLAGCDFCTGVAINGGDSGGAALDAAGRLVGINSARQPDVNSLLARPIRYRGWLETILPERHRSQFIVTPNGIRYRNGLNGNFADYPAEHIPGAGAMQAVSRFVAYPGGVETVIEYLFRGGRIWLRQSPASVWGPDTVAPPGYAWTDQGAVTAMAGCSAGTLQHFNTKVDRTRSVVLQGYGCDDRWYARAITIDAYTHAWDASAAWDDIGTESSWLASTAAGGLSALRPLVAADAKVVMSNWAYAGLDITDINAPTEIHYQSIGFDKALSNAQYIGWYRPITGDDWTASWVGPYSGSDVGTGITQVLGGAVLDLR